MTLDLSKKIAAAHDTVFKNEIEGWVGDRIWQFIAFSDAYQRQNSISGDVLEIGVHHGKLFFIIASACGDRDKAFALDLFERQDLNVDKSGQGSIDAFKRNTDNFFSELKEKISIFSVDSMSITTNQIREFLNTTGVRICSVDGGHTVQHVIHDLSLAQEIVVPGGIVLLDDFLGPHWPTVTEGLYRYLERLNTRLAPFLVFQNKLFLTTFSEHDAMLKQLRAWIEANFGDEIHRRWKYVSISGYDTLSCA